MAKKTKKSISKKAPSSKKKKLYFGRLKKESFRKDLQLVSYAATIPR
jgi:hypothetical protein